MSGCIPARLLFSVLTVTRSSLVKSISQIMSGYTLARLLIGVPIVRRSLLAKSGSRITSDGIREKHLTIARTARKSSQEKNT
uniref:Putative secreted protein n=1 Tax=Anopheles triannulatus TaxID=58253 RepID=A0A2M4B308_9DIPT